MAGKPPKAMSSRLLTMKFMQRAAASSPLSSPSTPDQPSAKRQKTRADDSPLAGFDVNALANQKAIESALASEEAKRQIALDKQASEAGDTRWVLNFEQNGSDKGPGRGNLKIQQASFSAIDRDSAATPRVFYQAVETSDNAIFAGRRSFGKFNRKLEKLQDPEGDDSDDSDSDDDGEPEDAEDSNSDDDDPTSQLMKTARDEAAKKLKAERKSKRKAEKAELLRLSEIRKKKNVKLNNLTSISGGNGASKGTCYKCGETGHFLADCPKGKKRGRTDDDGDRPRSSNKSRKSG
ncbi:hypothetical protein V498_01698 [Pseudogymnoascus sp. VKM F-4517 (FW-2822)]|nr:hypothetical protein V498_01698 [Pseudogymnoascus sp. VKM F-4517 (FW-2822)]